MYIPELVVGWWLEWGQSNQLDSDSNSDSGLQNDKSSSGSSFGYDIRGPQVTILELGR